MRMKDQIACPGVKDADQADLSANEAWIKRKVLSSFGGSLKEQGIEGFLIGAHQITQFRGQSEGQKEIRDGQE